MEKLKFSPSALVAGLNTVFGGTSGLIGYGNSGRVRVYSGPQISRSQFNASTTPNDIANSATSAGCTLLWEGEILSATVSNNTAKVNDTPYAVAKANGTATWFVYMAVGTASQGAFSNAFMGTISDATGTGDMRLTSTDIVSGQQYRINAVNLMIPYEFTF